MNVTSLCLNVDIKVNINYPDWAEGSEEPTLDNSRDIDAGWFLLEIIKFISVVNSIIWRKIFVEKEIFEGFNSWSISFPFTRFGVN